MSRNLERTFSVAMPVERVWSAMTDPDELNRWYFPFRVAEDGSTRTEILGVERQAEVVAYEPPRRFCLRTTYTGLEQWPPLPPGTQGDDRRAGSHGLGNARRDHPLRVRRWRGLGASARRNEPGRRRDHRRSRLLPRDGRWCPPAPEHGREFPRHRSARSCCRLGGAVRAAGNVRG